MCCASSVVIDLLPALPLLCALLQTQMIGVQNGTWSIEIGETKMTGNSAKHKTLNAEQANENAQEALSNLAGDVGEVPEHQTVEETMDALRALCDDADLVRMLTKALPEDAVPQADGPLVVSQLFGLGPDALVQVTASMRKQVLQQATDGAAVGAEVASLDQQGALATTQLDTLKRAVESLEKAKAAMLASGDDKWVWKDEEVLAEKLGESMNGSALATSLAPTNILDFYTRSFRNIFSRA